MSWLAIWAIFVFAFFTKSSSKLVPYILPVIPPLALLIAVNFDRAVEKGKAFRGRFISIAAVSTVIFSVIASFAVYSNLSEKKTSKLLALKVKELAAPQDMIASFGYDQTMPFYAARRTVVIGGMGELEFGSQQGDNSEWFISHERFMQIWESERKVFLVLRVKEIENSAKSWKVAPRIIAQNRRDALVTNH